MENLTRNEFLHIQLKIEQSLISKVQQKKLNDFSILKDVIEESFYYKQNWFIFSYLVEHLLDNKAIDYSQMKIYLKNKDSYGNGWSRTYDSYGNRLTYKDSDGLIWSKTYDDNDNELNHKQSNGYEETRTYDANNNELTYKDSNDVSLTYTYDDKGNLTSDDDNIYKYNRENGLILFKNGKEILSIPKFKV